MMQWQKHEQEVAEALGLRLTITSGNKWFDQGDGVTPGRDHPFPLYVDAKYTVRGSYSINGDELRQYQRQAEELGKRMILAVRLNPPAREAQDYVVLSLHDFAELFHLATAEKASE